MHQKEWWCVIGWFWKLGPKCGVSGVSPFWKKRISGTILLLVWGSCFVAIKLWKSQEIETGVCFALIITVHETLAVSNTSLKIIFIDAFLSSLSCAGCLLKELLHKERETENSTSKMINNSLKMLFKVVLSASYTWQRELGRHTRNTFLFVLTSSWCC